MISPFVEGCVILYESLSFKFEQNLLDLGIRGIDASTISQPNALDSSEELPIRIGTNFPSHFSECVTRFIAGAGFRQVGGYFLKRVFQVLFVLLELLICLSNPMAIVSEIVSKLLWCGRV